MVTDKKVELVNEWTWVGAGEPIHCRDYAFGEWYFSACNPSVLGDSDTDLDYIDQTIEAWTAWREFVIHGLAWNESPPTQ